MEHLILKITTAILLSLAVLGTANAGSFENMERERAILLNTLMSAELNPAERSTRLQTSHNRLIDLERIFLRDKAAHAKNSAHMRAAFENYDLTFLVHAATEKDRLVLDHWLDQLGLSTSNLMTTRLGQR